MSADTFSGDEVAARAPREWRAIYGAMEARFRPRDFASGLEFVNAIGAAAEEQNHHPDIELRYGLINLRLSSHDVGGMTQRDLDLAARISALAAERGIPGDPGALGRVEIALDTPDAEQIRPFWAAVLGLRPYGEGDQTELRDPEGGTPTIWFQPTDQHAEPRQRFHLDIRVPPEIAGDRIAAALAAGGVLVTDEYAPRFTVLADAQGNKVCVCTHVGRR